MIDLLYECTKDNIELQGTYFNSLKKIFAFYLFMVKLKVY